MSNQSDLREVISKLQEFVPEFEKLEDELGTTNDRIEELQAKIQELQEIVEDEDIPSPTIPEYVEHHASIQKILNFIGKELL
jgi:SMC interacting uncharacterized protein involved in chromosome segregation